MIPELNKWYMRKSYETTWYFRPIRYLTEKEYPGKNWNEVCYAEIIMIEKNTSRHYYHNFFMKDICGHEPALVETIEDLKVALL
jgi:hypothetical protein